MHEPPDRVGTTLRGKYHLERLLGSRGMATVYAGTHRNGLRVAVKVLHPWAAASRTIVDRFLREGDISHDQRSAQGSRFRYRADAQFSSQRSEQRFFLLAVHVGCLLDGGRRPSVAHRLHDGRDVRPRRWRPRRRHVDGADAAVHPGRRVLRTKNVRTVGAPVSPRAPLGRALPPAAATRSSTESARRPGWRR